MPLTYPATTTKTIRRWPSTITFQSSGSSTNRPCWRFTRWNPGTIERGVDILYGHAGLCLSLAGCGPGVEGGVYTQGGQNFYGTFTGLINNQAISQQYHNSAGGPVVAFASATWLQNSKVRRRAADHVDRTSQTRHPGNGSKCSWPGRSSRERGVPPKSAVSCSSSYPSFAARSPRRRPPPDRQRNCGISG